MSSDASSSSWADQARAINRAFAAREAALVAELEAAREANRGAHQELADRVLQLSGEAERQQALATQLAESERSLSEQLHASREQARALLESDKANDAERVRLRTEIEAFRSEASRREAQAFEAVQAVVKDLASEHRLTIESLGLSASERQQALAVRLAESERSLSEQLHASREQARALLESDKANDAERVRLRSEIEAFRSEASRREAQAFEAVQAREQGQAEQIGRALQALNALTSEHAIVQKALLDTQDRIAHLNQQRLDDLATLAQRVAELQNEAHQRATAQAMELELRQQLAAELRAQHQLRSELLRTQRSLERLRGSWHGRLFGSPGPEGTVPLESLDAATGVHTTLPDDTATVVAMATPAHPPSPDTLHASRGMPMNPHADASHAAESLAQLLTFHDDDFVRCAYLTVLGRPADPDGLASFSRQIRLGVDREQIIAALATSTEGTALIANRLPGMSELIEQARRNRPSLFTRAIRRVAAEALRPITAQLQNTDRRLAAHSEATLRRFDRLDAAINGLQVGGLNSRPLIDERHELGHMTAHSREIYFQLKDAAAKSARVSVS